MGFVVVLFYLVKRLVLFVFLIDNFGQINDPCISDPGIVHTNLC